MTFSVSAALELLAVTGAPVGRLEVRREERSAVADAAIAKFARPLPQDNTYVYFTPWVRPFRADPRFMHVARGLGLTDYWSKSGKWPDFCFEPGLPYDCKAEAAKLTPPVR